MRRLLIVLAVLVACMAPRAAYAREVDYLDSFTSGVGTWGSESKEEMDSDSSEKGIESGNLLAVPAEDTEGEQSTVQHVNSTLDAFNTVTWNYGNRTLFQSVRNFFVTSGSVGYSLIAGSAVTIVFLYWGVRKSVRVLMAAFRRGKANV